MSKHPNIHYPIQPPNSSLLELTNPKTNHQGYTSRTLDMTPTSIWLIVYATTTPSAITTRWPSNNSQMLTRNGMTKWSKMDWQITQWPHQLLNKAHAKIHIPKSEADQQITNGPSLTINDWPIQRATHVLYTWYPTWASHTRLSQYPWRLKKELLTSMSSLPNIFLLWA